MRPRSGECGFTLLEIMIALVLFSIAAALVTSVFVNALGGSGASRTGAVSDAAIERTTAALRDDVARAITADRANSRLRDPTDFQVAVRTNAMALSTDPDSVGVQLDIDDVVVASPTQLALRVDAASTSAGVECVMWRAVAEGSAFVIRRTVDPGAACGGGAIENKVLMSADTRLASVNRQPFSYDLLCNPTACGASRAPAGIPCRPWRTGPGEAVAQNQRRWVVGVRASLVSSAAAGKAISEQADTTSIAIRSRDTATYRSALGC